MTIRELFSAFDSFNRRHRAPPTVKYYRERLKRFVDKFGQRDPASLTLLEIDEYLFQAGQGQGDTTRHHDITAVTTLQNFAKRHKLLKERWFDKGDLEKPPIGRRERIPTLQEIGLLLRNASHAFRLIYLGLVQSGARPGECCAARIRDIKCNPDRIELAKHKTAKKTGKKRVIPIGPQLWLTIANSIAGRTGKDERIFVKADGQPWTVTALSAQFRRLRSAAGLDRNIVLYSARHFYATTLLAGGAPIEDVSALLGHASISTTQLYTHVPVTDLTHRQSLIPEIVIPEDPPEARPDESPGDPPRKAA